MTLEEIKDKFDMALAQRLTMDMSKCEVNFVLQGLAGFKKEDGRLIAVPFTMRTESDLEAILLRVESEARHTKEFVGISFAQNYMHYNFQAKEKEKQDGN